jgi:hypothetical protein
MLTPKEFRTGLKRLQYKDIVQWSVRMVRRLFNECDKNKDGLLSIKEFTLYILDKTVDTTKFVPKSLENPDLMGKSSGRMNKSNEYGDKLNLSDDEDDEIFNKSRTPSTDHQLLKKVWLKVCLFSLFLLCF